MIGMRTQPEAILGLAVVVDPEIRGEPRGGADSIVVRVMLCALADDVSLNLILYRRELGANTVATASLNVVLLNDISGCVVENPNSVLIAKKPVLLDHT